MKTIALPYVLFTAALCAQQQPPPLPVREVTVFKDGHTYVVRERALPAGGDGEVVLDELPQPLLGTFWPYATGGARVVAAKAGRETVLRERPAVDFRQIARANVGKDVVAVTVANDRIEGRLLAVPARDSATDGAAELMLLQTQSGTRAIPFPMLRDLEVRGEFVPNVKVEEQLERLVLRTTGGGPEAKVGVMYVQQGMRWIPAYRVDIDGSGRAKVQFEATLVNDLVDLDGATVNLVIGMPKFEFEGLVDPISLQQEAAQTAAQMQANPRFANALFNSLTTQTAGYVAPAAADPAPAADGGDSSEDLFVFPVRDVTLKRGERLVLPIATFELTYRDVYRLDVPFAPPMEVRQSLQSEQAAALARELAAPKARHVLRLTNGGDAPLTTAPALVLSQGRVLAQGRMRYTPRGAETDLEINVAVDICVEIEEHDTARDQTVRFGKEEYGRVDVAGAIDLSNRKSAPVELEVTRRTLGIGDGAGQGGSPRQLGLAEAWYAGGRPTWWGWWSWPHWWFQRNGFVEFRWSLTLQPGESAQLDASWHYFWR